MTQYAHSKGQGIDFSIKVSPHLEFPTYLPQEIKISSEIIPNLENIQKKLKAQKYFSRNARGLINYSVANDTTLAKIESESGLLFRIEGRVIRLDEWIYEENQGKVTILSKTNNDNNEFLIQLNQKDYYLAFEAQMSQSLVSCFGELIQENNTLVLKKVRNFSILRKNE